MAWSDLFAGIAFYLIIEGLFPFINPNAWRRGLSVMAQFEDQQLRNFGLGVVIAGLTLLYFVRG
ncbi:MAG: DUF2065 domain-containing protein [Rhodospirillaceae bacterium]|nr:DUF2065 domain-containing protein [Rhodospirillaceae bacterium]